MSVVPIKKHTPQQLADVANRLVKMGEALATWATPAQADMAAMRVDRLRDQRDRLVERAERVGP